MHAEDDMQHRSDGPRGPDGDHNGDVRGGSRAGSPELSLSYDEGSEMEDTHQDGADSQALPATVTKNTLRCLLLHMQTAGTSCKLQCIHPHWRRQYS